MAKASLTIEVAYNDKITDPEALASALDTLMETALSTPEILDEYGNPHIGKFYPQEAVSAKGEVVAELRELASRLRAAAKRIGVPAEDRLAFCNANPFPVIGWRRTGELDPDRIGTVQDIYEQANRLLDKACARDIVGHCVFQGEDQRWYMLTVEPYISEVDEDALAELDAEDEE